MGRLIKYILIFLVLSVSSCDKGFGEINENPFDPTAVSYGAVFNDIVSSLRLGWSRQLFLHNEVLYDVTEQAVVTAQTFGNITGGTEELWTNYFSALKNANELYDRYSSTDDPEIANVLKAQLDVLMAYKTFQVTDLFGDIPFSEAGRAFDETPILRPMYDDQELIYKTLIENLEQAALVFSSAGQTSQGNNHLRYAAFETLFNDDLGKWARFCNSLQLRHLVRLYEKDPSYVAPKVQAIIENGSELITKGNDALMLPRDQQWSNLGVNWSFREHNKIRMGSTIWEFFTDDNEGIIDPRANIFFETNVDDEWLAFPQIPDGGTIQSGGEPYQKDRRDNSYENKGDGNIYSGVNFYLIRDELDIPEILISSTEVQFLKAEIFLRGIGVAADPFLAQSSYQLGMLESLEFWQNLMVNSEIWINKPDVLSTGQLFETVQQAKYALDINNSVDENLKQIYAQRWVDLFRQPWEAFSLLRRTNAVPRTKASNTFFRFKYPPSESSLNTDNYLDQVSQMGADDNNIKVWWQE